MAVLDILLGVTTISGFFPTFTYNSNASIWISPFISTLSLESNVCVGFGLLNLI